MQLEHVPVATGLRGSLGPGTSGDRRSGLTKSSWLTSSLTDSLESHHNCGKNNNN